MHYCEGIRAQHPARTLWLLSLLVVAAGPWVVPRAGADRAYLSGAQASVVH